MAAERPSRAQIELLECRRLLSAVLRTVSEPQSFVWEQDEGLAVGYVPATVTLRGQTGALTGPRAGSPLIVARTFLQQQAGTLGVMGSDLASAVVTDHYTDSTGAGLTHIYMRQTRRGLPVLGAELGIHLFPDGRVLSVNSSFIPGLSESGAAFPAMKPAQALGIAASRLNLAPAESPRWVEGTAARPVLHAPGISLDPVAMAPMYFATEGGAVLGWNFNLRVADGSADWYDIGVADSGQVVFASNWTDAAAYKVFPRPTESPAEGARQARVDPWDAVASPFGWQDTNGVAGADSTVTLGNNVSAQEDADANNTGGHRPDGGAALNFDFTLDLTQAPPAYQDAAITNLYYWANVVHDVHYRFGFTTGAGNFQTNNYGGGGLASDAVQADAQDGSGLNNANFSSPPDGTAGRLQLGIWTPATPDRDAALDASVIVHELSHGVSSRLTGGPANANALNAVQSGGMSEGWSDWFSLMFMQRPGDTSSEGFGLGTYVLGQPSTGLGIRRFRYSYNMSINPLTFDAYGSSGTTSYGVARSTQIHQTGEIWCSVLWDLNWLLINKYGFDQNLATGYSTAVGPAHAGNKLALQLVIDGMKLQPANPSFTQARDAIVAADVALNGGANLPEIWQAFARRGLGQMASVGSAASTSTPILSFTTPMLVTGAAPATEAVTTVRPASYVLNFSAPVTPASLQAGDLLVNGQPATGVSYVAGQTTATFTFGANPVTAEGAQTIQVNAGAFTRASDSAAVGAFSTTFYYDTTPLQVTSISPPGGNVPIPFTAIEVDFNGAVAPSSVQPDDLSVDNGTVTGFTMLRDNTAIRFTIANLTREGTLSVNLVAGAVKDAAGNPSAPFGPVNYVLEIRPQVVAASSLEFDTRQAVSITFSNALEPSTVAASDLVALNLQNGSTPTAVSVTLSAGNTVATWVFNNPAPIADGYYRFSLPPGSMRDVNGSTLATSYMFSGPDVFFLGGDANRDRAVNIGDFSILASRFNLPGTFSQGDFNYSGLVEIGDFSILASKFNQGLPASAFARTTLAGREEGLSAATAQDAGWVKASRFLDELLA